METKEATQAMRDYVYAERAVLVAEMKKDLAAAQADLDRLSAEVDRSSNEAKAKAKLELDAAPREMGPGEGAARCGRERQWLSDEIDP